MPRPGAAARPSPAQPRYAWGESDSPSASAPSSPRAGPSPNTEPTVWTRPDSPPPRENWAESKISHVESPVTLPASPVTLPADLMKDAHIARIRSASPRASSPDTSSRQYDDLAATRGRLKPRNPTGTASAVDDAAAQREAEALAAIEAEDIAAAEKERARKAAALSARNNPGPVPALAQAQAQAPVNVPPATGQKRIPPKPKPLIPVASAVAKKPAPLPNVVNKKFIEERPDQAARDAAREEEWKNLSPEDRREAEALAAIEDEEIAEYEKSQAKKGMKAYPVVAPAAEVSPGAGAGVKRRPASASSDVAAPVVPVAVPKSAAVQAAETRTVQLPAAFRDALAGVKRPASASGAAADAKVVPSLQISSPLTMSNQSMSAPIISPRKPVRLGEPALQPQLQISSPLTSLGLMSSSRKLGGLGGVGGGSKKRTSGVNHKKTVKKNVKTNAPRPKKGTKKIVKYPKKRKFTIKIR